MWTFIDIKTGNAFNGEAPYIFWYENGQSINLNYVKQICIYTDAQFLDITCESDIFSILKMDQLIPDHQRITFEFKQFIDLDTLKVGESENYTWRSEGYLFNGNYVHMLYFLAHSEDTGEFVNTFYVTEVSSSTKHTYAIGADFYAINEIFQSNLENFELTLPESIQRAIYEENIHEESNDNILLNRKYKELLMNYWDIVANKGSYDSLVNSLKWFEWGDLVRIEEAWKSREPESDVYKLKDLQTQFNTYMKSQIRNISKTTYIGLYFALQNIEFDSLGNVVYQDTYNRDIQRNTNRIYANSQLTNSTDNNTYTIQVLTSCVEGQGGAQGTQTQTLGAQGVNMIQTGSYNTNQCYGTGNNELYNEEIPQLDNTIALWNNLDLCLKMTLLGNFYQTFFMPVHLDLIHSTIESWVFANAIKLLNGSSVSRMDYVDSTNTFDLTYEYE